MARMTRTERIQNMLPDNYRVFTYSPGDGQTRYKFVDINEEPKAHSYFAASGVTTVLGAKAAEDFADSLHSGFKYKIVRFSEKGKQRVIKRGLTLEQAQAHCSNPLTHGHDKRRGRWFDGYTIDAGR